MPHFFIILLKINLVLILFAAAYYLILRRLTFYVINRVFLVFGIVFATVYPFIDLTEFFNKQNQKAIAFVPEINHKVKSLVSTDIINNYWQLIGVLFYLGVAIMSFRLIVQFVSLYKMHKKSSPGAIANYKVRILSENVSPFSFWQTVYINPALHKQQELNTILAHEQIHVKQWHSLDIILAELSVVFYWFNPGVWLMKRAVKENLEFITDENILNKGIDKKSYQYSLLDVGNLVPAVQIVNNFNLSDLKKRIKMMNAQRSSKFSLSRYMLILPVLLVTTLAFTVAKKEEIKAHLKPFKNALIKAEIIDAVTITPANVAKGNKSKVKLFVNNVAKTKTDTSTFKQIHVVLNAVYHTLDSLNIIPDTDDKNKKLSLSFKYQQTDVAKILDDKTNGNVIFIQSTDTLSSESLKRKIDAIKFSNSDSFSLGEDKVSLAQNKVVVKAFKVNSKLDTDTDVNFFLNGKKITREELSKINPNEIKNVSVVKGDKNGEIRVSGTASSTKP